MTGLTALTVTGPVRAGMIDDKLWWRGTAHVEVGGRALDLAVETSLTIPLLQVRSKSYIVMQGPQTARTLVLDPGGAWLERSGTRSPLPAQLAIHERQQYALYAWLYLVQRSRAMRRQARAARGRSLPLTSPPYPDIVFDVGPDGYPTAAEWTVEAAEQGRPRIPERVEFTGRIDSNGIRWPTRFAITQGGKSYFDLKLTEFRAT